MIIKMMVGMRLRKKVLKTGILVCLLSAVLPGLFAQTDLQTAGLARLLRSEPISVKQLKAQIETTEKTLRRTLTKDQRLQVLNSMIDERLVLQAAERDKVTVTDSELTQRMQQFRSQLGQAAGRNVTDEEFSRAIYQQFALDLPAFREQLKKQTVMEKYLVEKKRDVLQSIKTPSEQDIRREFDLNKATYVRPETVQFGSISVPYTGAADKTKARTEIDRLAREIGADAAKFDAAVLSGQRAGQPYQAREQVTLQKDSQSWTQVGDDFMNAAFALKQGTVSPVLEIPSGQSAGFYLIKVFRTLSQEFLGLESVVGTDQNNRPHTLYNAISTSLLQARMAETQQKALEELVKELRQQGTVQVFEDKLNF
jgi:hypothetical protein